MAARSTARIGLLAVLLASFVAAGCSAVDGPRGGGPWRYTVVVDHVERASGAGAGVERKVRIEADVVEQQASGGKVALTFERVVATGDESAAAAVRQLGGSTITLSRKGGEMTGEAPPPSGRVTGADTALLHQVLLTAVPGGGQAATRRPVTLPGGDSAAVRLEVRRESPKAASGAGEAARTTDVSATGRVAVDLLAYLAAPDANTYVAQPSLTSLVGPAPDQPFVTTTTPRRVTKEEPYTVTIPGRAADASTNSAAYSFGYTFGCLVTLGLGCVVMPRPTSGSAPDRTETRYRTRTEVVQETTVVRGPDTISAGLSGDLSIATSEVVARSDGQLLRSTGTGRTEVAGKLPAGTGVPQAIAGRDVKAGSEWTASTTLVSPRPAGSRGWLLPALAFALLLAVAAALGTAAMKRFPAGR